jgi:hypothetical protein
LSVPAAGAEFLAPVLRAFDRVDLLVLRVAPIRDVPSVRQVAAVDPVLTLNKLIAFVSRFFVMKYVGTGSWPCMLVIGPELLGSA